MLFKKSSTCNFTVVLSGKDYTSSW